jgi:tetratricopeptide (TPR) repeat protein
LHEIQSGRAASGEAWIERALVRGAPPAAVHLGVGQLYESMSQPEGALTHYRRALALDSTDGSVRFAVGRALLNMGNTAEAIGELEKARGGVEGDNATQLLVLALTRAGRTDDVNRLIHAIDPSPWSADKARGFALALADAGRVDLSIAAWARAAQTGGDARDYERLGLAWAVVGRPAEAVIALERAVRVDPSSPAIRLNYAVALASTNRFADARREANESLRLDPGYERAKRFLEAIRQK